MKKKYPLFLLLIIPCICTIYSFLFIIDSHEPLDITIIDYLDFNAQGNYAAMKKAYEYLTHRYPEKTDLCYPLGWAYYKSGDYQKAYNAIMQYISGNPFYPSWKKTYIERIQAAYAHTS